MVSISDPSAAHAWPLLYRHSRYVWGPGVWHGVALSGSIRHISLGNLRFNRFTRFTRFTKGGGFDTDSHLETHCAALKRFGAAARES